MTIKLEWLDEQKQTLVYRIKSPLTGMEVHEALKEASVMSTEHAFTSTIFDLTECNNVPMNILSSISTMKEYTVKSVNLRIIVGGSMLVTRFFNIIVTLVPNMEKTVQSVATIEEALGIIERHKSEA